MPGFLNTNEELLNILKDQVKGSFLILDKKGNILSYNKEASTTLSLGNKSSNLFDCFNQASRNLLNELFQKLFDKKDSAEEILTLELNNNKELNVRIKAGTFIQKDKILIFLIMDLIEGKVISSGNTSLKIKINEIDKVINREEVLKVIEEIKSNYPFTFIVKNKIRKSVDNLAEYFWVKNLNGTYILVNDKLSAIMGLNFNQIEGKEESNFIPPYLINFHKSINKYIAESANSIIIDGLRFGALGSLDEYQTIEIPLFNSEDELDAIIGIGQKKLDNKTTAKVDNTFKDLCDLIPVASAFIDENNFIRNYNIEFESEYGSNFIDLTETEYLKILSKDISEKISEFINSSLRESQVEIKKEDSLLLISLRKVFNEGIYSGTLSAFEKKLHHQEKVDNSSMQIYNQVLHENPFPVFIFNKEDLKLLDSNEAALNLYGYSKEEFLNLDMTDLYTQEDMQTLLELTTENVKEGIFYGPYNHKKRDGSNILIEISKISIMYKGKEAALNIVRNVTKKIEQEKNYKIYQSVFNNNNIPLLMTDSSGFITSIDDQVTSILNYSKEELQNTSFAALFSDDRRPFINNEIFKSPPTNTITFSDAIKNSNGEFLNCDIVATPIFNYKNEIDSFIFLIKVKKGEQEISYKPGNKNSHKRTNDVFLEKDASIVSDIFHEILTPINVILGFVQDLTESIEKLTPEQREASDIINQNRIKLLDTMNSVIDYVNTSGDDADLNLEEIKITDAIDNLQKDLKDTFTGENFELAYGKISSSLVFKSDREKFQNLIYLLFLFIIREHEKKKIYISAYQYDDESFIVIAKDDYSFTSEELINSLNSITNGRRLINKNSNINKFNMLLFKKLFTLLNGSVKIIEESNKKEYGFLFPLNLNIKSVSKIEKLSGPESGKVEEKWLDEDLPVEKELSKEIIEKSHEPFKVEAVKKMEESEVLVEEMANDSSQKKVDISKLTCLCLEDQIDSQILFRTQMKEAKEIKFASSFEEALPILKTRNFDFILLDINLQGDYNGIDALKFIHKIPGYENTPIIAATAYLSPGDKHKFIAAGFDDFLSKPIFHDNVIESLNRLL
jgi:PAS domain S-box-containing protein